MRRDALAVRGKSELSEDETPEDFGLYYPVEYVRRAYLYLDRGWGWPEGGGWAEQDARLLDDLDTYHAQYAVIDREFDPEGNPKMAAHESEDDSEWVINTDQF